jgi:mono/diheme cytochrome c family protein
MTTKIFVVLAAVLVALVGIAAYRDSADRDYLNIQAQYASDYGSTVTQQVQQLFPSFSEAKVGQTFRVERCISCHVPDIATIGPELAAQRLAQDFLKYEPNAQAIITQNHLTGVHPAYIANGSAVIDAKGDALVAAMPYSIYGATGSGFLPYSVTGTASNAKQGYTVTSSTTLPGPLPAYVAPAVLDPNDPANTQKIGIDQVGCIVCHNGGRLALDEPTAHTNLIINPEYDFSQGAQLYYTYCVSCHGVQGEGGKGPPLSNQDRLGYFNEDYYYRCIEYGLTDFEHIGSIMPNWSGNIASDYHYTVGTTKPLTSRTLSEDQIHILVQFIRHWQQYSNIP